MRGFVFYTFVYKLITMNYIDIHCHLDFPDYDADRQEVLAWMKKGGMGAITIGADLESSKRAVEIAEANENVWACIGAHPEGTNLFDEKEFEELVKSPKVVGIGECGLDYFRLNPAFAKATADKQKKLFEYQIQFALKYNKPLMLHIRDAYNDALDILKNYPDARGNVHFFAGDTAIAQKFLDLGFTMSFTGVITFTHDYDEVIKYIPQNYIMSETDAPFVAPMPYRGKRNEPVYVIEVVKKMAEVRGEVEEILKKALIENAERLFDLKIAKFT
jgi:TatD DNase family protein